MAIDNHLIGGGFGRRLEVDGITIATRIAKHVDGPVKVIWTREEDILPRHVPASLSQPAVSPPGERQTGGVASSSHGVVDHGAVRAVGLQGWIDKDAVEGAIELPYDIPNRTVRYQRSEPPAVPTGFWRDVRLNDSIFAVESFVDRLAKAAGVDPLAFRRSLLTKHLRALAALELAAKEAGWGEPLPARSGRGISLKTVFGSNVFTIAQGRVADDGRVTAERLTIGDGVAGLALALLRRPQRHQDLRADLDGDLFTGER